MAASASLIASSQDRVRASMTLVPTLTESSTLAPSATSIRVVATAARSARATTSAWVSPTSGRSTANSSPPIRANTSLARAIRPVSEPGGGMHARSQPHAHYEIRRALGRRFTREKPSRRRDGRQWGPGVR